MHTDVFLVRHGESLSNVEGRLCGIPPGPGLTERGRQQAEAAARRLLGRGVRPSRIVSSPLARAIQSAEPLARATGLKVELHDALREVTFGAWEGMRTDDLWADEGFRAWCLDPERVTPPGGERLSEVAWRVGGLTRRLAAMGGPGAIVGYSHMHPLIGLVLDGRGHGFLDQDLYSVPNAAIVHVRFEDGILRFVSLDPLAAEAGGEIGLAL